MIGVVALFLFYAVILFSGYSVARAVPARTPLGLLLLTFTFAASQLLLSIQVLSLFRALRPLELTGLNVLLTISVSALARRRSLSAAGALSFEAFLIRLRRFPQEIAGSPLLGFALLATFVWFVAGLLTLPNSDSYHFAMPLFWRQNQTILPFAVCNPRTIGVVFASEGICLPGALFAGTVAVFPFITWIAVILAAWLIVSLAEHTGATRMSAIAAGTTFFAYSTTAVSLLGGAPDVALSALWFGASLYFLFEYQNSSGDQSYALACSVLSFSLACGAKNLVLLQAPVYLIAVLLSGGRRLLSKRAVMQVLVGGIVGLIVSGLLWSYVANWIWFGTPKGHSVLQGTIAQQWSLGAVWTRVVRAAVSSFIDPIWIPGALQDACRRFILGTVRMFGAREVLAEDDSYYCFANEILRPGRGLGWMGFALLAPSLAVAVMRAARAPRPSVSERDGSRPILILLVVTLGSFITTYAVLRTQSIGVSRLMLSSILPGVPLAGLLLTKRLARVALVPLVCGCLFAYTILGGAIVLRRMGGSAARLVEGVVFRTDRGAVLDYRWIGESPTRENVNDVTWRTAFAPMLARIAMPTTIGIIGNANADEYFLFGPSLNNRVLALNDCRAPERLLPAPPETEFIVVALETLMNSAELQEAYPSYELWLEVDLKGVPLYQVLRRKLS